MNKLIIKIYFLKYYDYIFLLFLILIFGLVYYYQRQKKKGGWLHKFGGLVEKVDTNKGRLSVLILLLTLGFLVRLYKIENPVADWHSFRQADTASVTRIYIEEGLNLLLPRYHDISTTQSGLFNPEGYRFVEFPVFSSFHYVLFKIFPFTSFEIWGRLVSILSSLVSAYIVYLLGKRFISLWGGLLASFFFLFIPFNIYFSRVILPEPLAISFALLSLWLFIKFVDNERRNYLFLASLSLSTAILIKPYAIFYTIPMFYLAYDKYGFREVFKKKELILFGVFSLVPFALWRFWMQNFPEGIPFWKWTFNGDDIRFKPAFWYWIFGERLTGLILGFGGVVPFIFGLLTYRKTRVFIHIFLLGMFLYICVFATANVRHDYYQSLIIPSVSLSLAAGSLYLWKAREFNEIFRKSILVISIAIMFLAGLFQVKEFYKINHPEIIEAGYAVDRLTPKNALVIAAYNGDTAFLYQTKRCGWPVVDRPIDELIERGAQYYSSVNLNHPQTQEFMARFEVLEKTDKYVVVKLNKPDANDTN